MSEHVVDSCSGMSNKISNPRWNHQNPSVLETTENRMRYLWWMRDFCEFLTCPEYQNNRDTDIIGNPFNDRFHRSISLRTWKSKKVLDSILILCWKRLTEKFPILVLTENANSQRFNRNKSFEFFLDSNFIDFFLCLENPEIMERTVSPHSLTFSNHMFHIFYYLQCYVAIVVYWFSTEIILWSTIWTEMMIIQSIVNDLNNELRIRNRIIVGFRMSIKVQVCENPETIRMSIINIFTTDTHYVCQDDEKEKKYNSLSSNIFLLFAWSSHSIYELAGWLACDSEECRLTHMGNINTWHYFALNDIPENLHCVVFRKLIFALCKFSLALAVDSAWSFWLSL